MRKAALQRRLSAGLVKRKIARATDQRNEIRHGYRAGTGILRYRARIHVVSVHNISLHGATIGTEIAFSIGERVDLYLRKQGYIAGSVCWIKNARVGLEFDAPLMRLA